MYQVGLSHVKNSPAQNPAFGASVRTLRRIIKTGGENYDLKINEKLNQELRNYRFMSAFSTIKNLGVISRREKRARNPEKANTLAVLATRLMHEDFLPSVFIALGENKGLPQLDKLFKKLKLTPKTPQGKPFRMPKIV